MTEKQWLSCTDPGRMLYFLRDRLSPRKRQLFACACVRQVWDLVTDETCRRAIEVSERFADGVASEEELRAADEATARGGGRGTPYESADLAATYTTVAHLDFAGRDSVLRHPAVNAALFAAEATENERRARRSQAMLLRDIVGNPFRPVTVDPSLLRWNDGTVQELARMIFDERRFDDLPLLADALEDAGYHNEEMLAHCRQKGQVHTRGCWVIDLLLNKG